MVKRCPYCGCIPEQPLMFSYNIQRIFNYIWDNPNCTSLELNKVFSHGRGSNTVMVQIGRIRLGLSSTNYRLRSEPDPTYNGSGRRPRSRYKIIEVKPDGTV